MILEMSCLRECRAADVTLVGFFAGVNASMIPKGGMTGETFVTHLTDIGPFAAVCAFVILKMG